jgi:hypothetical protein
MAALGRILFVVVATILGQTVAVNVLLFWGRVWLPACCCFGVECGCQCVAILGQTVAVSVLLFWGRVWMPVC